MQQCDEVVEPKSQWTETQGKEQHGRFVWVPEISRDCGQEKEAEKLVIKPTLFCGSS